MTELYFMYPCKTSLNLSFDLVMNEIIQSVLQSVITSRKALDVMLYLVGLISCGEKGKSSCPATEATLMMIIKEEMTDL